MSADDFQCLCGGMMEWVDEYLYWWCNCCGDVFTESMSS